MVLNNSNKNSATPKQDETQTSSNSERKEKQNNEPQSGQTSWDTAIAGVGEDVQEKHKVFEKIAPEPKKATPAPELEQKKSENHNQVSAETSAGTPESHYTVMSDIKNETHDVHRSHFPAYLGLAVVLMTLFGLGGVYAYWNGVEIPFLRKPPAEVMERMLGQMRGLKTLSQDSSFLFNIEAKDAPGGNTLGGGSMKMNGKYVAKTVSDFSDPTNANMDGNIDISFTTRLGFFSVDFSSNIDVRAIGDELYIKLNNISDLGFFDLSPLEEHWIRITMSDLGFDEAMIGELKSKQGNVNERLQVALYDNFPLFVSEELPEASVNGINTYHYKLKLDEQKLKKAVDEVFLIFAEQIAVLEGEQVSEQQRAEFEKIYVEDIQPYLSRLDAEVWIGKKDFWPYRAKASFPLSLTEEGVTVDMNFSFNSTFDNHNAPVSVAIPGKTISFEEALWLLESRNNTTFNYPLLNSEAKGRDTKRISDIKQIQAALEFYYDECGEYPRAMTDEAGPIDAASALSERGCGVIGGIGDYMDVIPNNPTPGGSAYMYCSSSLEEPTECALSGESYMLFFQLETDHSLFVAGPQIATPLGIESDYSGAGLGSQEKVIKEFCSIDEPIDLIEMSDDNSVFNVTFRGPASSITSCEGGMIMKVAENPTLPESSVLYFGADGTLLCAHNALFPSPGCEKIDIGKLSCERKDYCLVP